LLRGKTKDVQNLTIPEMLRPFLRAWHVKAGSPVRGPVFPVMRDRKAGSNRKGGFRGKTSYAARWRRALMKAGVTRHELHFDTPYSRKTDGHTWRRAYVSALAASGANEQTAMALTHHADSKVHKRYQLAQIVDLPTAALPLINESNALASLQKPPKVTRIKSPSVAKSTGSHFSEVRILSDSGAGEGIRTLDVHLGKVALYH
jgi:hypothetical protein